MSNQLCYPLSSDKTLFGHFSWHSRMIGSYRQSILKQPSYSENITTEMYLLFHCLNQILQKDIFGNLISVYMAYPMLHWNGIQELKILWIVTPEQYPKLIHHCFYGIMKMMSLLDIFLCMLIISYSHKIKTFMRQ